MTTQPVTSVNCPNCRSPFTAPIQQIIDVQGDPAAKPRLLSGRLNSIICPHCGFQGALNTPFIYHDAELELALVYMPMEVGKTDIERQRAIGDLTNRLMQRMPTEARKGYLLQPRTFFSVQNLIDALLERDEATRELVEMQRRKLELFDELRQIDPSDSLAVSEFVGSNDTDLDETFFQLLEVMINVAESQSDSVEHDRLLQLESSLQEKSSTGRLIKMQRDAVQALASDPTRETLIEQLIASENKQVREALVTVGRQLLDYAFFQALTARIDAAEAAGDGALKDTLLGLRKEVQEIRDQVDARAMEVVNERATLLRNLLVAEDPREMLTQHLLEIDDVFLGVLNTNIQQATASGRLDVVEKLRGIGDTAIELITEHAPPEIRLVNKLVSAESNEQVVQLLEQERGSLDQDLLELIEHAAEDLKQGGRQDGAQRLHYAAERIKEMISA
jgi:hypothetical protein